MRKLKYTEVKTFREELWLKQEGICPLCKEFIFPEDAALDHAHGTTGPNAGHIRGVLHLGCNLLEGKITHNIKRNGLSEDGLKNFLENYISYTQRSEGVLHPTHKTPEEKKALAKKRRLRKKNGR